MGVVLRTRLIMIPLLVTGGMGGDLEKLEIGKIIIWVVLRCRFHHSKERMTLRYILSGRERWRWFLLSQLF